MPESTDNRPEPKTGCAKMLLGMFAVIVAIGVAVGAWSWITDDPPKTITMYGEIVFSDPSSHGLNDACVADGHTLVIDSADANPERVALDRGERANDGTCTFTFARDVPDADRYEFTMPGANVNGKTVSRSMIDTVDTDGDTVLRVRLSW